MTKRIMPLALCMVLLLSACANTEGEKRNAKAIGGIVGFVVGSLLGSSIGDGAGQQVTRGVGAILGAYIGSELALRLVEGDIELFNDAVDDGMENNDTGEQTTWENPDSGNAGSVTPTTDTYETVENTECRDFESTIVVEDEVETANGRACRQPDGSWKIVQ